MRTFDIRVKSTVTFPNPYRKFAAARCRRMATEITARKLSKSLSVVLQTRYSQHDDWLWLGSLPHWHTRSPPDNGIIDIHPVLFSTPNKCARSEWVVIFPRSSKETTTKPDKLVAGDKNETPLLDNSWCETPWGCCQPRNTKIMNIK